MLQLFAIGQPSVAGDDQIKTNQESSLKFSGYFQPQFRVRRDDSLAATEAGQFSGGVFARNANNEFDIRRGRVKATYTKGLTQAVIQLDATPGSVIPVDIYGVIVEPWLRSFGLQVGLFNRPFGYEVELSSGKRESPERTRATQTLFPGERDIGAKLFYKAPDNGLLSLEIELGVMNGTGRSTEDYDSFKDIITQASISIPLDDEKTNLGIGASGYFGKVASGTQTVFNPSSDGFLEMTSADNLGKGLKRTYYGGNVQFSTELPSLGTLSIRGEVVAGKQPGTSSSTVSPSRQPSGDLYQRNLLGWYVNLVQNLGSQNQIVVKYDVYDPNTDAGAADFIASSNLTPADVKFSTLGFGFIHHWDSQVKFVFYYEVIQNEELSSASSITRYTSNLKDDIFTLRMQVAF